MWRAVTDRTGMSQTPNHERHILQRWTAKHSSSIVDCTSEIEEHLLQCHLVTSTGMIVVTTDDCSVLLLPDPKNQAVGSAWQIPGGLGCKYKWTAPPAPDINEECVMASLALDNSNGLYMLDGRNKILFKVLYTLTGITGAQPMAWKTNFTSYFLKFESDVSMLFVPGQNLGDAGALWVPCALSLQGDNGQAVVVNPVDGSYRYQFVPKPAPACKPNDFGSAALSNGRIAIRPGVRSRHPQRRCETSAV